MFRHAVLSTGVLLALVLPAGALADTTPATGPTITATGTGQAPVTPQNRNNNQSIVAAVKAADKAVVPLTLKAAHDQAIGYAQSAGLTLGSIESISDTQAGIGVSYGPYGGPFGGPFGGPGPFGPGQYCGIVNQPVFKIVHHRRKLVRVKHVHRCLVVLC